MMADIGELFGEEAHRLRGVHEWEQALVMGRGNLERACALGQKTIHRAMADGEGRGASAPGSSDASSWGAV